MSTIETNSDKNEFLCHPHTRLMYQHGELLGLYFLGGLLFSTLILSIGRWAEYAEKFRSFRYFLMHVILAILVTIVARFYARFFYRKSIARVVVTAESAVFETLAGSQLVIPFSNVKKFNKMYPSRTMEFVMNDGTEQRLAMNFPHREAVLDTITREIKARKQTPAPTTGDQTE